VPPLMALLQTRTRFVFATGANDDANLAKDGEARLALGQWCIPVARTITPPNVGHAVIDGPVLARALAALDAPAAGGPRLQACRTALDARIAQARAAAAGADDATRDRLDRTYGALLEN
jgi:hypothetical protein